MPRKSASATKTNHSDVVKKNSVRSFLALELPDDVKSFVATLTKGLKSVMNDARWVSLDGMHLTLKFLGDVPSATIPEVVSALEKPLAIGAPIQLSLKGLGCFPNMRRPRVIWIGVMDTQSVLLRLVEEIEKALLPLGFPKESRLFKAHLTLARLKPGTTNPKGMELIVGQQELGGPTFFVDNAVLFESILKPQGAQYYSIRRFYFQHIDYQE